MELAGTETHTVEVTGTIDPAAARRCVGRDIEVRNVPGGVEIGVLFFAMERLGMVRPVSIGPRFDYAEALWRIGISLRGQPGWFAVACDLDAAAVRALGALLVRYPVRRADIAVTADRASARTTSGASVSTTVHAELGAPEAIAARPLLVRSRQQLFRIPWREEPAPFRREVEVEVDDAGLGDATFGSPVAWANTGLIHRGRTHRCGMARRHSA